MPQPTASGKGTILITGANGGLGCAITSSILSSPELRRYHGLYVVRNASSARSLANTLKSAPDDYTYEVVQLELSVLDNVRQIARDINARVASRAIPSLRALILAAGYMELGGASSTTSEGFETSFVSNYLGHWLLSLMLLQSIDPAGGRIVVVSSHAYDVKHFLHKLDGYYEDEKWHLFFHDANIDAVAYGTWSRNEDDPLPRRAGVRRYGVAKMCAVMMVGELQRRLDQDPSLEHVSIVGIDPGCMGNTGLCRRGNWFTRKVMFPILVPALTPFVMWYNPNGTFRTVRKSSRDILEAAFGTDDSVRGRYLNGTELQDVVPEAADSEKRLMVWRDSVRYTELTNADTCLAF
ncbi:putative short-chain dehydrogenase [Xylariaceae sp. FL1019]|nr:putative short-chain dehydrogenase [Xylariaceae sp. FL1019]